MAERSLELLNIYELMEPEGPRHLVAFLEPVLAELHGIVDRAVIGEFTPRVEDGEFDPATFVLNPEFVVQFIRYMNEEAIRSQELLDQAARNPSAHLHLVDPRNTDDDEPPLSDVLGRFSIDENGQPVPGSFEYNREHRMFDPVKGPSDILMDLSFYNWLHPIRDSHQTERMSDLPIVP